MRVRPAFLFVSLVLSALVSAPLPSAAQVAQEAVDLSVVQRIRQEGLEHSQIERLIRHLTEVIGPRLTGSPAMKRANEWTAQTFRDWGLSKVQVEPWGEFGRGWEQEAYMGRILTPYQQPLMGIPSAWTGSTKGTVRGQAVIVKAESVDEVSRYKGKLEGTIVLMDQPEPVDPEWQYVDRRFSLESLLAPRPRGQALTMSLADRQARRERAQARRRVTDAIADMAASEGADAILRISNVNDGVIRGGGNGSREKGAAEGLPQIQISREQYNEIYRNVSDGVPVQVELMVKNKFFDDDLQAYNTLAEIPGTDLADQYVMIGAHLDSWHYGNGATDNGAGSVVMMEAMRILETLGLKPRRTVRVALWSAEEQGLLGSRGWVAKHPELHDKISVYLNVDNGSGRIRGIWDQSNEKAIPVFEQILWPFRDLGVVAVKHGDTGGTDHLAFDAAGIPGFNFIQDPIEYSTMTHHTDLDTFDHLVLDDLKQAAVVVAATAYDLAMRDDMMPRKDAAATSSGR